VIQDSPEQLDVAVIGSGFGGLCAAIKLREAGLGSFAVLERGDAIGGTWRDNLYPGCACDVQSHLYSYSFAPNPRWSRMFSSAWEIREYLERCADEFDVRRHVRLRSEVTGARWDAGACRWTVDVNGEEAIAARALVVAKGLLSEPHVPTLPGLASFGGTTFHSAAWDHDHDLTGERVAVIGTGATAVQFIPEIAPLAGRLHVFQRSAPWVLPRGDRPITRFERRLFERVPALQRAYRGAIYAALEGRMLAFAVEPRLTRAFAAYARWHIERQIDDPRLRDAVTPDYTIGCKRVLLSNDYYPALAREDVELETARIERVTERGIVTADGREVELDTIVFATGFRPYEVAGLGIAGRDGVELAEAWSPTPTAHLGTTVAGFPNLFLIVGPNTGLGHSSMVFMIESQTRYVIDALRTMRERGLAAVEVRPEVQAASTARVHEKLATTVWASGCDSWYLDDRGRNPTIWPTFSFAFRSQTRRFRPEEYVLVEQAPARELVEA
jgi:cation diffusion facilitator CzcD-associated flavoprotein CzcO